MFEIIVGIIGAILLVLLGLYGVLHGNVLKPTLGMIGIITGIMLITNATHIATFLVENMGSSDAILLVMVVVPAVFIMSMSVFENR